MMDSCGLDLRKTTPIKLIVIWFCVAFAYASLITEVTNKDLIKDCSVPWQWYLLLYRHRFKETVS